MTRTKRGRKKRNAGWFKKGHDARRSTYRFTAQDCRVGWLVANCKHPHLRDWLKMRVPVYYWQKEYPLLRGNPQAPILTRLDTFLRPKMIRNMVSQRENRLDFVEIMKGPE